MGDVIDLAQARRERDALRELRAEQVNSRCGTVLYITEPTTTSSVEGENLTRRLKMNPILLRVPASMLDDLLLALRYTGLTVDQINDEQHYVLKRIPQFLLKQEYRDE